MSFENSMIINRLYSTQLKQVKQNSLRGKIVSFFSLFVGYETMEVPPP